jgi:hypothetical protein
MIKIDACRPRQNDAGMDFCAANDYDFSAELVQPC